MSSISAALRPGSSDLGLVVSNAFDYFFKPAAYLRRRVAGLFSNRDLQMSKLFVDVDEPETNLSTEFSYMRTHGEPLAGIHLTPPALLCRVETKRSEAAKIPAKQWASSRRRFGFIDAISGLPRCVERSYQCRDAVRRSVAHFAVTPRRGRPGNRIGERSPLDPASACRTHGFFRSRRAVAALARLRCVIAPLFNPPAPPDGATAHKSVVVLAGRDHNTAQYPHRRRHATADLLWCWQRRAVLAGMKENGAPL
jgi:hypothetical protein